MSVSSALSSLSLKLGGKDEGELDNANICRRTNQRSSRMSGDGIPNDMLWTTVLNRYSLTLY